MMNKNEYAYEAIKGMILSGALQAGALVSESALAGRLGMSRTPIREAIRMLSRDGLIHMSGQGATVKSITIKEAYDLSEIRVAIECIALKTAICNVPEERVRSLLQRWDALLTDVKGGAIPRKALLERIAALDTQTHMLLIDHCDNRMVPQLYENVLLQVQWFQRMISSLTDNSVQTVAYHIELLTRMLDKDVDGASDVIRRHVYDSLGSVSQTRMAAGIGSLDVIPWA